MKRREFIQQSLFATLLLELTGLPDHTFAAEIQRDPKKLSELFERSRAAGTLSMTGVDPTIDFFHNRRPGVGAARPGVAFFNDQGESAVIDVPTFVHSIEQNPDLPNRIMLIPRSHGKCFEFDVATNKVTAVLRLKDRHFYGHGCYVPGTNHFYSASVSPQTYETSIVLFDYKLGKLLREVNVPGGAGAHQCSLSRDGRHVIMTFTRKTSTHSPSIVWVDVTTGSVVERVSDLREQTEHFTELGDGHIIFAGGLESEAAETVLGRLDPTRQPLHVQPGKEFGGHFNAVSSSICALEEKSMAFVTNITQDSVYVINYKTGAPLKRLEVNAPRGLSLSKDRRSLFVTSLVDTEKDQSRIAVFDVERLLKTSEFSIPDTKAYANHISPFRIV